MKSIKISLIAILGLAAMSYAAGPVYMSKKINYQGKIEIDGSAYTGSKSFRFKIYDALSGGTEVWDSGVLSIDVDNGVFSAVLSGGTPTLSTATFTGQRWLEMTVDATTLTPREEIMPAPFAMLSGGVTADAPLPAAQLTGALPALDASNLYNLPSGIGTATTTLQMGAYGMNTSSHVSAGIYQIDGSTVLSVLPIGSSNLHLGTDAGRDDHGLYNTYIGKGAGKLTITGSQNVALGSWTGEAITTGNNNVLLGLRAGDNITTGSQNIIIGPELDASASNVSGELNIGGLITGSIGSSSVTVQGDLYATTYYGDGSNLSGISGDSLGNHVATTTLQMGAYGINTSSSVNAGTFQVGGKTVLALGGSSALIIGENAVGGGGAASSGGTYIGYNAGYSVTSGGPNAVVGSNAGYDLTGGSNVLMGPNAGQYLSNGANNVVLGYNAGRSVSGSGAYGSNVLVGDSAGFGMVSGGDHNVMVGYFAGYNNTTGRDNTAVGLQAGFQTVTGSGNALFGYQAGRGSPSNTLSSSTVMGYHAGYVLGNSYGNILLGFQAGDSLTTGSNNIIIGYDLDATATDASNELNIGDLITGTIGSSSVTVKGDLYADNYYGDGSNLSGVSAASLSLSDAFQAGAYGVNTSSDVTAARYQINGSTVVAATANSLYVGITAGRVSTGIANTFVGQQAGYGNTTANSNTFLGYQAGRSNTGANNGIFGVSAGYSNTGSFNLIFGDSAGYANTGSYNVVMGVNAGQGNEGDYNVIIGQDAGGMNTGDNNVFVGKEAGYTVTSGSNNSVFGADALHRSQTGSANAVFGYSAGAGVPGQSFSSSTLMGYMAGRLLTSGSDNILLGFQAGDNLDTGSNNIIIGYDLNATTPGSSNELNIGGLIMGTIGSSSVTVKGDLYADTVHAGLAPNVQGFTVSGETSLSANGAEVLYVYAMGATTIGTITGCDSGLYHDGQRITLVFKNTSGFTLTFADTAYSAGAADTMLLDGDWAVTGPAARPGSTLTLMCVNGLWNGSSSYNGWTEVSRFTNAD